MMLAGFVGVSGACVMSGAPAAWNPTSEFSISNGNPNGVWSYGQKSPGLEGFVLMQYPVMGVQGPLWGARDWSDLTPSIWLNTTPNEFQGIPSGVVSLHPGPSGEAATIRFTSPVAEAMTIRGKFTPGNSGIMLVGVMVNEVLEWHAVDAGPFWLTRTLAVGGTVDFVVYGGYGSGATGLIAEIGGACPADLNGDGLVEDADFSIFVVQYDVLDCADAAMPLGCRADLNGDSLVDDADFVMFVKAYDELVCP